MTSFRGTGEKVRWRWPARRVAAGVAVVAVVVALGLLRAGPSRPLAPGESGVPPEARAPAPAQPAGGFDVAAPVAFLMDADTGQVLFSKEADKPLQPASIAKVMTLLVALDAVDRGIVSLDDQVRVGPHAAAMGGSQVYLAAGEVFPLEKLLRAVAIASANDAAVAVAEHVAGTEGAFVELMNRRAADLGLKNTHFTNAHGLPPEPGQAPTLTTAREIAIMARELIRRHPQVLKWTSERQETFRERPPFILTNTNRLIGTYPGADGLKTGYTAEAGYSVVATASQNGRRLIAVVMQAESEDARVSQAGRLLDFGFRAYRPVVAALEGERVGVLRLANGQPESVPVRARRTLSVLTLGGESRDVSRRVEFRTDLAPPIREGQEVGWVVGLVAGQEVARVPVEAERPMGRATFLNVWWRRIRDALGGLIPGALVGGSGSSGE